MQVLRSYGWEVVALIPGGGLYGSEWRTLAASAILNTQAGGGQGQFQLNGGSNTEHAKTRQIEEIKALADCHETAAVLTAMIQTDGAGSWPPRANHAYATWPAALRPYEEVYREIAPLLPQTTPSFEDVANRKRITDFRVKSRKLLHDKVNLPQVKQLLEAVDAGRWDLCPRDVYNAFYCCIASSRHAYRWATIPVIKVAQLEKVVEIPDELSKPWVYLQNHFGCSSQSGNNTSNLLLNFDVSARHMFKINTGMPHLVTSAEEAFARIFYDVESQGVPIYHDMILAIINFAPENKPACAESMGCITAQLRPLLSSCYDNMHDGRIAQSVWLSRVQGFYAWGAGFYDDTSKEWVKYDGLSGNQVMLFQALDAFLGIEPYLSSRDQERNVPAQQRALCRVFEKYSFRNKLSGTPKEAAEAQIAKEFREIVKRLRVNISKRTPDAGEGVFVSPRTRKTAYDGREVAS
ncbi:hypothetical protein DL771_005415 [Monosporascus sp. 5C6A]|nr:hypothetical protein DL771_005415 [Monosporascus sp. 5C6A]